MNRKIAICLLMFMSCNINKDSKYIPEYCDNIKAVSKTSFENYKQKIDNVFALNKFKHKTDSTSNGVNYNVYYLDRPDRQYEFYCLIYPSDSGNICSIKSGLYFKNIETNKINAYAVSYNKNDKQVLDAFMLMDSVISQISNKLYYFNIEE